MNSVNSFDVSQENFSRQVLEASHDVPVLVDFWAPWCGPCQSLMPVLQQLADSYQGRFRLAKVNIDELQQLASEFGVRSVPTVKLLKDGVIIDEFTGALPESQIRALLDRHIERESDRQLEQALGRYAQGAVDEAITEIKASIRADPDNPRLPMQLATLLIQEERYQEAADHLKDLPRELRDSPEVQVMQARLAFAESATQAPDKATLLEQIDKDPKDSEARYQLSARYIMDTDYEAALEQLLEIVRRDRAFRDDAGRKAMLQVFTLLGDEGDRVNQFRKKMTAALF